ncbi:hypothetical protein E2C01_052891 [Portunus trituberculatus]|uniref:Uncharacterized protein n=1 Tax=Portunus trituberculatus TaxID=210409 RepID=A0A5B7GFR1_PORTR|nr:hypothetical protein [Portunus trituberculatus]
MEEAKICSPIPIQDPNGQPLCEPQKAEALASHYHQKIGPPHDLHPPSDLTSAITTAIISSGAQELTQPFTLHKMASALRSLKAGKSPGPDYIPYEFLIHSVLIPSLPPLALQHQLIQWKLCYLLEVLHCHPHPQTWQESHTPCLMLAHFSLLLYGEDYGMPGGHPPLLVAAGTPPLNTLIAYWATLFPSRCFTCCILVHLRPEYNFLQTITIMSM